MKTKYQDDYALTIKEFKFGNFEPLPTLHAKGIVGGNPDGLYSTTNHTTGNKDVYDSSTGEIIDIIDGNG